MTSELSALLNRSNQLLIQQKKQWTEIILDWETANKYAVLATDKTELGFIAERRGGFWTTVKRLFLRTHRSFEIDVLSRSGKILIQLSRNFFYFF